MTESTFQLRGKREPVAPPLAERLSPKEAAEYLGLSVSTLRDWRSINRAGPSPIFYQVSRNKIFYWSKDLEKFLAARKVTRR